jgi:hypothetical protein
MNAFTSPRNLQNLLELKKERESKIDLLINNLKIENVKEESSFNKSKDRIKKEILFNPVKLGDLKFMDYEYVEKSVSFEQQLIGGRKGHYIHKLSLIFSGSGELFEYTPEEGFTFTSSDHGVILPTANAIFIDVDLPELNPSESVNEARRLLRMTFEFVEKNNISINQWNAKIEPKIDSLLEQKRKQLIDLFGTK